MKPLCVKISCLPVPLLDTGRDRQSCVAPHNSVVQVSIKRFDGLYVAQVDVALPASFRDLRTKADFSAECSGRDQYVLQSELCNFGHEDSCC